MNAKVSGTEISYEVHGREGAPWLVLSHSLACSTRMWDPQIEAFKGSYRVLAYDMRGHGQSEAPATPYTLDMLAEDVVALMRHARVARASFIGLSIGGMIGQTLALKHPDLFERMVLADTGHAQNAEAIAQWEERIRIAQSQGMGPLVEPTMARWFTEGFRKTSS